MKVRILTAVDVREFEADAVFLPGTMGCFEVLPGHAPIMSSLEEGKVRWRRDGLEDSFPIKSGVVRFRADEMNICAE